MSVEVSLQRIAGRRLESGEAIHEWCAVWYSRPARLAAIAPRFRDYAVVTDRRLMLFEAGWLTRRPRRRILADRLDQLAVTVGTAPGVATGTPIGTPIGIVRRLRIEHRDHRPVIIEFGRDARAQRVAQRLAQPASPRTQRAGVQEPPGARAQRAGVEEE